MKAGNHFDKHPTCLWSGQMTCISVRWLDCISWFVPWLLLVISDVQTQTCNGNTRNCWSQWFSRFAAPVYV